MKTQKPQTQQSSKINSWKKLPAWIRGGIIFGGVTLVLELADFYILTMFNSSVFPTRSLHLFHTYGDSFDFLYSWGIYILIGMIVGSVMRYNRGE